MARAKARAMGKGAYARRSLTRDDALRLATRCLGSAQQFKAASDRANERRQTAQDDVFESTPLIPAVVCSAFAVELAFKAVLLLERNEQWNGHDLQALFGALHPETQAEIRGPLGEAHWSPTGERVPFDKALAAIKGVFEQWRYVYEQGDVAADFGFLMRLGSAALGLAQRRLAQGPAEGVSDQKPADEENRS